MEWAIFIALAIVGLVWIMALVSFFQLFRLWVQAFLAGARISVMELFAMKLRRTPAAEVVRLKIMATQSGLAIPASRIESAILQGADVERAVLALIRARETGAEVTWEEVLSRDADERLREKLLKD